MAVHIEEIDVLPKHHTLTICTISSYKPCHAQQMEIIQDDDDDLESDIDLEDSTNTIEFCEKSILELPNIHDRALPTTKTFFTCIESKHSTEVNSAADYLKKTLTDRSTFFLSWRKLLKQYSLVFSSQLINPIYQDNLSTPEKSVHTRSRVMRFNNQFLKLYALDYNARSVSKTLPMVNEDNFQMYLLNKPRLIKFHRCHNLKALSVISKNKLWKHVLLNPRLDDFPNSSIDCTDYIEIKHNKNRGLRPAGVLPGTKVMFNSNAPNSGVSKSQYTLKGWVNKKWLPQS